MTGAAPALVVAGIAAIVAGTLLAAAPGHAAAGLRIQAAGLAVLGAGGAVCIAGGVVAGAAFSSELRPAVGIDPLTGAFLLMLGLAGAPAAAFAAGYLPGRPQARALAALSGLFPLALAGVLVARDATLLLGSWELMTLVPAAAVLIAHGDAAGRRAVFEYLAITHIGGAGVWVAVLVMASQGALGDPAALGGGAQALVSAAAIVGFGTKAGLVPLHAWLPRVHPLAPANVSALMSGVMVKVALYGLARLVLTWLESPPAWAGLTLMALGALSAITGVLYALLQRDLKRLLAFSTIENAGIVALALGAATVLGTRGEERWAALAVGAALLHGIGHALAKALLFLASGSLERAGAGRDLDRMGGLLARMPRTGAAVLAGALTMAGVPLLVGFASEWAVMQALLALGRQDAMTPALAGALGAAALAATTGLAALCFVTLSGLALLGSPRSGGAAAAREAGAGLWAPLAALGAGCLALGAAPGILLPSLAAVAPGGAGTGDGPGIAVPGTSLPALGLALGLGAVAAALLALRGRRPVAPTPVWACGQAVEPPLAWTSAAFTQPVRLVLWGARRVRHDVDLVSAHAYAPAVRAALAGAAAARRLQSGSLRLYIAYLVGVVVLLLALARAGALG